MELEEGEPVEPVNPERCPNPACHCFICTCGEDCSCSFLENCPCASREENIPSPPE